MAPKEEREVAPMPARVATTNLPILPPFDNADSIVQALSSREVPVLTAGLLQVEKRALALVAKAAPRAVKDPILDYLATFPMVEGVFAAWDTAHKTNNSQLSAAVLAALSALIRLVSTDPFSSEPEIIRRLLSQYGSHLDRALNPGRNDVTVAALKLCNVVVGFGSGRFARRLWSSMAWSPKIVTRLFRTRLKDSARDPLNKPDIRTLLTMLVLAFFSAGDSRLKSEIIDSKGMVSGMIKGLSEDPEVVVNHVLVGLYNDVVTDRSIGLEVRRSIFDEPCIVELVKLYDIVEDDSATTQHLRLSAHRFCSVLTEWLATQINDSQTRSFGPQKVLGTLLRTLKVTEDPQQRELGVYILERAPILAGIFWSRFPSSLDPRLSSRWISAITLATLVVSLPVSPHLLLPTSPSPTAPPSLASVLDNIFPPTLTRVWYAKALQHESPLVSFLSSIFLLGALQKATGILEALSESSRRLEEDSTGRWAVLAVRVRDHCRTILPDPQIVVALMQKTAVAPVVAVVKKSKKGSKAKEEKVVEKVVEEEEAKDMDDVSGRHLRTNVALRLLWLYHRAVPSLIATLRFDFARLPQAHVARTDAEGIRAISSAYALRLAAIHSPSLSWSRPGDHFKNTLLPLFHLYRTPSTPSNLHLLLSILGRLLQTPILFGTNPSEVEVWLQALPTPSSSTLLPDTMTVMTFFESCVQKTLTAPIKTSTLEDVSAPTFSPLLASILAALPSELSSGRDVAPVLSFLEQTVLGFIGQSTALDLPKALVGALEALLSKSGEQGASTKVLKSWIKALEGVDIEDAANDFVAAEAEGVSPEHVLSTRSTELAFLQVRPSDLSNVETAAVLTSVVVKRSAWHTAMQVLLHRYLAASRSDADRQALSGYIVSLVASCGDERTQKTLKASLVGEQGVLAAFVSGQNVQGITDLVAAVLSPTAPSDLVLAQPYCSILMSDVASVKVKTKSSKPPAPLPVRVLASASLLPFFNNDNALGFLNTVLSKTLIAIDASAKSLLDAALLRVGQLSGSDAFRSMWTTHFVRLHRLSTEGGLASAGAVLALGAQALLPFVVPATAAEAVVLPFDGFRHGSSDLAWQQYAAEWTTELLSQETLGLAQSQVLATLIYRSSATRTQFAAWIAARSMEGEGSIDGAEAALRALLEVGAVLQLDSAIPQSIAVHFVNRLFTSTTSTLASDADLRRAIELMCSSSTTTSDAIQALLATRIAAIDRDSFTPTVLLLVSDLAKVSAGHLENLESFLNESFSGLVRRFAEDEEDTPAVNLFVQTLNVVLAKHHKLVFKSHLLDPLITAAITRRLSMPEPTALAAALCRLHQWKANEVTRHLNAVFASAHYHARLLTDLDAKKIQSSILSLVFALSSSSVAACASARAVEKLMPFYGGTLSSDDTALIVLFQKIELVAGGTISTAFSRWNPSLDQSPVEATRAGSLAALQTGYVHRAYLRICASSRTTFPREHSEITYDPHFLLPYLQHTIAEDELKGQDWINILESGVLGLAIAGLASSSPSVRANSRSVLASTLTKLQDQSFREKDEIILVLTHARNCIYSQDGEAIPAVIALFLANCIQIMATPESPLYPAFSRFLLQRPLLDQRDVPMFYLLFYSTSEEPVEDHRWLLKFLSEGLVRTQDWKIYRRRQTYELLASLLQTSRQDPTTRKLILQFLLRATSIPQAARELLSRNGLLGWISSQVPVDVSERRLMVSIVGNIVDVLSHDKIAGAADALDALVAIAGSNDLSGSEISSICNIITTLVSHLPISPLELPSIRLILDRTRILLSLVAGRLVYDPKVQTDFYHAVMVVGFARHTAGEEETRRDKELFNKAVSAALAAGNEQVRTQTLRSLAN